MKRFEVTETGYKHDKLIYYGAIITFGLIGLFIMLQNGMDFSLMLNVECHGLDSCDNPILTSQCKETLLSKERPCVDFCKADWCKQKTLLPGSYGDKPKYNWLIKLYPFIVAVICILSMLLNHYIHNRGKSFDFKITVPGWKKIKEGMKDE